MTGTTGRELVPAGVARSPLFGRESILQELQGPGTGVVVVYGDSGVGKSALLRQLAAPALVPTVHTFAGSLVNTLMQQLAEKIAVAPAKSAGRRVADALRAAVAGAAGSSSQEVVLFLGRQLASIVRARWGDEAGESLEGFVKSTASDLGEAIQSRLAEAMQPEAPAAFAGIAREVAELLGGVHLVVDSGPGLSSADLEVLAALPALVPPKVRVTIAVTVSNADQLRTLLHLQVAGVIAVEVPPLDAEGICKWLVAVGLDSELTESVRVKTGGYPLFIETALPSLEAGSTKILEQEPPAAFKAGVRIAWQGLRSREKMAAQRLAFFSYPLNGAAAVAVAGLGSGEWPTIREALIDTRVFSVVENGGPWFHDRKRKVLQELLMATDRENLAKSLVDDLWGCTEVLSYQHYGDFATIVAQAPIDSIPNAAASAVSLSRPALACWSALVELREPYAGNSPGFVTTSGVLQHARESAGESPAPSAIEELQTSGFAFTVADGRGSVTTLLDIGRAEYALLLGRCVGEFGGLPFPSVAGALVRAVIMPRLYGYAALQYGTADESTTGLPDPSDASWYDLEPPPWGLTIRARLDDRIISAHAAFTSEEARDQAAMDLQHLPGTFYGEPLSVDYSLKTPAPYLPATRFVRAWNMASKMSLGRYRPRAPRVPSLSPDIAVSLECRMRALLRQRSSLTERIATGLISSASFAYAHRPTAIFTAEVVSSEERVIPCEFPPGITVNSPLFDVEFARFNGFQPGERLVQWTVQSGHWGDESEHPGGAIVCRLSERAVEFNKEFGKPIHFPDLGALNELLEQARAQALADALAFLDSDVVPDPVDEIRPMAIQLILHQSPWEGSPGRARFVGRVMRCPSDTPGVEAVVMERDEALAKMESHRAVEGAASASVAWFASASEMLAQFLSTDSSGVDDRCLRRVLGIEGDYRVIC